MQLTLDEAAVRLGKTARQIRYLIQSKRLPARKVGGRWVIESSDLPLSEGQRQAVARKERQLRAAVEEGLGLAEGDDGWLAQERGLVLKGDDTVRPTTEPSTYLGFRVSRAGLAPGLKAKRRLRQRLRNVESARALARGLTAYRGMMLSVG